jgi:uncharacterized phage-associated protein
MTNVFDVAAYILQKLGPISVMKLQKRLYYCQAWSLVWDDDIMFSNRIEAWANGPIVKEIYDAHKGKFLIAASDLQHDVKNELTEVQRETIDTVLKAYGDKSAQWLNDQTHAESPWQEARVGLPDSERGNKEITHASLAEYYGSLSS